MTETPGDAYPALFTLAQIYFSEDWPDFYDDDPMIAVDAFLDGHPGLSDRLPEEIETMLSSTPSEDELAAFFRRIELLYDPLGMDGQSHHDWLVAVARRARDAHRGPI